MNAVASHDTLTIVNGPEDGTEFALTNRSMLMGSDPACAVNVRLDTNVFPLHGRISVVADGYRVRGTRSARVAVNGRRVGVVRSRVLRHGDVVRLGETDLALACHAGGLAQRSRGVRFEHDAVWALREAAGIALAAARRINQFLTATIRAVTRHPFLTAAVALALAYWRLPAVRDGLAPLVDQVRRWI